MKTSEKVQADILGATRAGNQERLTTLLIVKSALKDKENRKREPLTDAEETQILTDLIEERKELVKSPPKNGEPAAAETNREIAVIEAYLPQATGDEEIRKLVHGVIAHMQKNAAGVKPGPNDMETAEQVAQQWIRAAGLQPDGKLVHEIVKAALAK